MSHNITIILKEIIFPNCSYPWLLVVVHVAVAGVVDASVGPAILVSIARSGHFPSGDSDLFRVADLNGVDDLVVASAQVTNQLLVLLVVL